MATQTKPAPKININQQIGGPLEPLRDIFEYGMSSVLGGPTSFQEGPVSSEDYSNRVSKWQEIKPAGTEGGSLSGFQTARRKEDVFPQLRLRKLQSELASAHQETLNAEMLKQKRIEVNTKLRMGNVLYEDPVRDDGTLRTDVEQELARVNSELKRQQLKAQREEQLVAARKKAATTKGAVGPKVNLKTTFEDQNMQRPS